MLGGWESWEGSELVRWESWEGINWKSGEVGRIVKRQGWRGWRAVLWQVGKGGGRVGSKEMARWERCEGSEVARWER